MYSFGAVAKANEVLWSIMRTGLSERGLDTAEICFDSARQAVPSEIGGEVFLTQVCGYPLFKQFRNQARILVAPSYRWPGCVGATHRAYFIVRSGDEAVTLDDMRGRVFGCNSPHSNSGMNLPRLTLARLARNSRFFSQVKMTGSHTASLMQLGARMIDMCAVDCVTWGLLKHHYPAVGVQFRVLAETIPSPSLPFVTSVDTPENEVALLVDVMHNVVRGPETLLIQDVLGLTGLAAPDLAAYERLADYEQEAARLGYREIE